MHRYQKVCFARQTLLLGLAALLPLLASGGAAAQSTTPSIEDKIQQSSSGVGRFRGGFYGSVGWGFGSRIDIPGGGGTRPSGLHLEGGVYGLFNPIRDFFDIEAGLGLSGMTPSSSESNGGGTSYKTGYVAGLIYAGPVFRLGQSGSALSLGVQALLGNKVLKDSNDAFVRQYPATMKSKPGFFAEYQYQGGKDKAIYFSRLTGSKYDVEFEGAPASVNDQGKGNTLITVQFGIKY